jgi:tetratricopeptide (TPR) repeat protein
MGKYAEAEKLFRDVDQKRPRESDGCYGLGRLYLKMKQFERAEPLLRRAVTTYGGYGVDDPRFAECRESHGCCFNEMGRFEEALPLLRAALATNQRCLGSAHPRAIETLQALAQSLRGVGQPAEAAKLEAEAAAIAVQHQRQEDEDLAMIRKLQAK